MENMRARFKPMDGFGGNPLDKESWWMMTEGMALRAAQYNIFNEVESFARENGLYNFALNLVRGTDKELGRSDAPIFCHLWGQSPVMIFRVLHKKCYGPYLS